MDAQTFQLGNLLRLIDAFPADNHEVAVGQVQSDLQANYALISQSGFMSVCPKGSNF